MSTGILRKEQSKDLPLWTVFETIGTLANKALEFETTLVSQFYLHAANPQLHPFGFLMGKIGVLPGLVRGILSPCLIKFSTVGESPGIASGFSGY